MKTCKDLFSLLLFQTLSNAFLLRIKNALLDCYREKNYFLSNQ